MNISAIKIITMIFFFFSPSSSLLTYPTGEEKHPQSDFCFKIWYQTQIPPLVLVRAQKPLPRFQLKSPMGIPRKRPLLAKWKAEGEGQRWRATQQLKSPNSICNSNFSIFPLAVKCSVLCKLNNRIFIRLPIG